MNDNLEIILNFLRERSTQAQDWLKSPYLYLDPEGVQYLFQELTGLKGLPSMRLDPGEGRAELRLESGPGSELPLHLVYQALVPLVRQKAPLINRKEELTGLVQSYAWVQGMLQGTRFPDGAFNIEILFHGTRGLLFYTRDFFSSMLRPLLDHDRIFTLQCPVEALVYVHGPVMKQIFYHHTYGDNKEHDWLPLVPVAIQACKADGSSPGTSENACSARS
ncbi:MAG: hypothetical protein JRI95_05290 [Deltaproteobacteria bacterium]|nr:hypothetical protein [Deltaproteobacteria bacterium]